ncbi:CdaR family transcriptional regulator [Rhodococcus sp. ACS1]|uniref:PucR family transcriptional regulator n=1 Tax=Rhodococcus sp. ACS1 TaxID=2028570 RepID=UPI00211C1A74|nr:helix-turn-helix domain-containing protein [Rhodococcus sp. ACS1]
MIPGEDSPAPQIRGQPPSSSLPVLLHRCRALQHRPELIDTLRAYLAHNLDRRSTAHALFVHPNTVDNRLTRVHELTGLDVRVTTELLTIAVAAHALNIARCAVPHAENRAGAGADTAVVDTGSRTHRTMTRSQPSVELLCIRTIAADTPSTNNGTDDHHIAGRLDNEEKPRDQHHRLRRQGVERSRYRRLPPRRPTQGRATSRR